MEATKFQCKRSGKEVTLRIFDKADASDHDRFGQIAARAAEDPDLRTYKKPAEDLMADEKSEYLGAFDENGDPVAIKRINFDQEVIRQKVVPFPAILNATKMIQLGGSFVDEEYRHQGINTAQLEWSRQWGLANGYDEMVVVVANENPKSVIAHQRYFGEPVEGEYYDSVFNRPVTLFARETADDGEKKES
ncbi:GNAT family N-acetyltransferase [Candidatus Saccharibacteria bacterium]|nr:GNAT family N-acetyltransferase [Candidatus Saccharibacteria bacterium]MCL1963372.1 GNAT family N-acetyltransferase [Candidatus Saccharibacteria bacterium]